MYILYFYIFVVVFSTNQHRNMIEWIFNKQESKETMNCHRTLFSSATEEELLFARILLELPNGISNRPKFDWGRKARRSAPSAYPPPVVRRRIEVEMPKVKAPENGHGGEELSPDTPLNFPTNGHDDDNCSNSSKKMATKEYDNNNTMRAIKNAKECCDSFKAENLQLKGDKQEFLNSCQRKEEPPLENIGRMNFGRDLIQQYTIRRLSHPQPSISADPTAHNFLCSFGPITDSSNNGLEVVNPVGPIGIPDLNISAEEVVESSQPLDEDIVVDDRRAKSAEARRIRRGIIKDKSMRNVCDINRTR